MNVGETTRIYRDVFQPGERKPERHAIIKGVMYGEIEGRKRRKVEKLFIVRWRGHDLVCNEKELTPRPEKVYAPSSRRFNNTVANRAVIAH